MKSLNETADYWVGKTVRFFPDDTYYKAGKILSMTSLGTTIEVTKVDARTKSWKVGEIRFIGINDKLSFTNALKIS